MAAWLAPELISVAICWRLDRRDGVALGFTSHDRDIVLAGLVYRAAPGLLPSAITASEGFDVEGTDLSGALSSDAITARDLAAGRWDGAVLRVYAVNWEAPEDSPLLLTRGELGDVAMRDDAFTAELRGPTAFLERPVVERTSPECRAELGDRRCRVDLSGRTVLARVADVIDATTIDIDDAEPSTGGYAYGWARFVDGSNSGLRYAILASEGVRITLRDAPAFGVSAGTLVELIEGCDKSLATCGGRFANAANFRGEPHLPGNDLLTRYPGG